jgi:hypothetical protein
VSLAVLLAESPPEEGQHVLGSVAIREPRDDYRLLRRIDLGRHVRIIPERHSDWGQRPHRVAAPARRGLKRRWGNTRCRGRRYASAQMRTLLVMASAIVVGVVSTLTASAAPTALPSACGLLTDQQAMRALGTKIAYRTSAVNEDSCTWTSVTFGANGARSALTVGVSSSTRSKFELMQTLTPGAVALPSVGSGAFGLPGGNPVIVWAWRRGIILGVSTLTVASPLHAEKTAATFALRRI